MEISYSECLELLPLQPTGNSMFEFKQALISLGFSVEAVRLSPQEFAGLRVPAVVLVLPPRVSWPDPQEPPLGHYLVLWPLGNGMLEILDHPRKPISISITYWIRHLQMTKIENLSVLLCGRQVQRLDEMLVSPESRPQADQSILHVSK